MTVYHKHYPQGTGTYTGNEPPPYIPHAPTPLYAPPLAEADTWPYVPRYPVNPHAFGQPAPRRVYLTPQPMPVAPVPVRDTRRRHSWLYWRVWWLWWALAALWDDMRYGGGGWLGQVAFLAVLATSGAAAVVSALLVYFWLAGR